AGLVLAIAAVAGVTWAVADNALPRGLADSLKGQLTEHRVGLWHDALTLSREKPLRGSGPDTFSELSTVAQQTAGPDRRPHSAPLQISAELGVPGVVLLAAAYGWVLLALWVSPRPTP